MRSALGKGRRVGNQPSKIRCVAVASLANSPGADEDRRNEGEGGANRKNFYSGGCQHHQFLHYDGDEVKNIRPACHQNIAEALLKCKIFQKIGNFKNEAMRHCHAQKKRQMPDLRPNSCAAPSLRLKPCPGLGFGFIGKAFAGRSEMRDSGAAPAKRRARAQGRS